MTDHHQWLRSRQEQWESLCLRCGACCGAMEDPCEHLCRDADGKYFCLVYADRLGERRTLSGTVFRCVSVIDKIRRGDSWPGSGQCPYWKAR